MKDLRVHKRLNEAPIRYRLTVSISAIKYALPLCIHTHISITVYVSMSLDSLKFCLQVRGTSPSTVGILSQVWHHALQTPNLPRLQGCASLCVL